MHDSTAETPTGPTLLRANIRPLLVYLLASLAIMVVATAADQPLWRAVHHIDPAVRSSGWFQALRSLGYLPVWMAVAVAVILVDRSARRAAWPAASRGLLLATSVVAASGLGEILKLLIRRLRPELAGGEYVFRPFIEDPLSTSGLGMPSGHAMVAFAAAWALCRLWPAAAVVWIAAAAGCATTRVLSHAHFVSDTALAAVVAFAVVRIVWACGRHLGNVEKNPNRA